MTVQLISMNLGCKLTILVDGKVKEIEWSAAGAKQPREIVGSLHTFLMEELEMSYMRDTVSIAKPIKKLKPTRPISHKTFNKKIKELGYAEGDL
ncbi:hypothetical protein KW795_03005 [Candidatus Microgenomates bacterium]|nr:hypothetical protein [Candidatus Microgenomates bacterium]